MSLKKITIALSLFLITQHGMSQETAKVWTLNDCLNYAVENNIQIKQSRNNYLSGLESTAEAKAALFPSLSASVSQGFTNYPSSNVTDNNSYTGTYGVNAKLSLFEGGRLKNSIKQQHVEDDINQLKIEESVNDIRIAILQAYMQCLYAQESINAAVKNVETSQAQQERGLQLWESGAISKVDYAQLESQLASDKYQEVVARKNLENYNLQLKQLLELDINESIAIAIPTIENESILVSIDSKNTIYNASLEIMPQIQRAALSIESSKIGEKIAKAAFFPSLSLSAGIGTGHSSNGVYGSGSQVWNRLNENIGVSLSIPILSNRKNKTALNQARIATTNNQLESLTIEKSLLRDVESAYLDATSSQAQYLSAVEKLKYTEQSYSLISEQFGVGLKNTVELLTAQTDYFTAQLEVLQAKYMTVMSIELLNIYQGNPINQHY